MAAVCLLDACCSGVYKQCWQKSITMLQNCGWELEHGTWNYSDCATTLTFRGNLSVPNWAEQSGGVLYSCKLRWLNKHSFSRCEGAGLDSVDTGPTGQMKVNSN